MPLLETKGAGSAQGFGLTVGATASGSAIYIEDVFSAYTYTGTGASLTITNNINLSANGGLTWIKGRSGATNNNLFDTTQGVTKSLHSNTNDSTVTDANSLTAFNTTGFTLGSGNTAGNEVNTSAATYVSWTFEKQAKFFDIVTYTGNGSSITVSHSLGSTPGCIIVKKTNVSATASDWVVYHRSVATDGFLNTTNPVTSTQRFSSVTSTNFTINVSTADVNENASTYVAYIFAHDAGGFGLTGTDNVISCGTFTTDGSGNATVNLGYEPQLVIFKAATTTSEWIINDSTRGWTFDSTSAKLVANTAAVESQVGPSGAAPRSTGFVVVAAASNTWIYIAIRRGPMKVPTLGTSVYNAIARTGTGGTANITGAGFPPDLFVMKIRDSNDTTGAWWTDRFRGLNYLSSFSTNAEVSDSSGIGFDVDTFTMDGVTVGAPSATQINTNTVTQINWFYLRAPSVFDIVCYTGTGSNTTQTHNLGVVPQLIIVKRRDNVTAWDTYCSALANTEYLVLNTTAAKATGATRWNSTTPTSSVFSIGTSTTTNASAGTYVAYLFAT